jgi:cAMP phosphodiesterase
VKVRLLPSFAGRDSQCQALTCFLINDRVAIDGGSLGFALAPEEMGTIRHIVVTHSHSDHIASLPVYIAESFTLLEKPVVIYGTEVVIAALRQFIFNDHIWPDFEKIPLPNNTGPTIEFKVIEPNISVKIAGLTVRPVPVNHVVPTVGLVVEDDTAAVVFTSDTHTTDEIWEAANDVERLKAIFVDVSYPDELRELADVSKHLTPELLGSELKKLNRETDVYAVHIKPTNRDEVIRQLERLNNRSVMVGEVNRVYEW